MKIEINKPLTTKKYPYIGIHKDDIDRPDPVMVYFIKEDTGVLLSDNSSNASSRYESIKWDEAFFILFEGSITLSN